MNLKQVGQIIATREFIFSNGNKIKVVIGKPEPFTDGVDFYCPWQIVGSVESKINYSGGIDSIQALLLALKSIGAEVNSLSEGKSGHLKWVGSQPGDNIGLPVLDNFEDLLKDKKQKRNP